MDVQSLEKTSPQKTCSLVQSHSALFSATLQNTEKHLGVSVVRRDLYALNRHHAHPWVLQLARDQLRQIALDLIGHLEGAVGRGCFSFGHRGLQRPRDFPNFEEFQLIAFDDVVVILDIQAAFETLLHFARIVLEAFERLEFTREDDHVVAQQT